MRRALALLMLFLAVGSATGTFAELVEAAESCGEDCGEGDEGCCPLVCPRCVCVARGVAVDVPAVTEPPGVDAHRLAATVHDSAAPESAEPREIAHVPKHSS